MPILSKDKAAKRGVSPSKNANTRRKNAEERLKALNKQRRKNAKTARNSEKKHEGSAAQRERFIGVLEKEAEKSGYKHNA